jgi:polysaccharide biosynthesis/export protein
MTASYWVHRQVQSGFVYMKSKLGLGLLIVFALAGCAGKTPPIATTAGLTVTQFEALPAPTVGDLTSQTRPYQIGAFDKLTIIVFGIDDLSGKAQVDASGRVSVPLAGTFEAVGKTPEELARLVEQRLRVRYVRNPNVTVNVDETLSQTVTVDGEIREPGVYPVQASMTLMRTIATAKGVSEFAKLDDVVVFRTVDGKRLAGLFNLAAIRRGLYADPAIYANDVVIVGDSPSRRLFKNLIQIAPLLTTPIIIALQKL